MSKIVALLILMLLIQFCLIHSLQQLYWFVMERCDITNINEDIVANLTYKCYKTNRTHLYLNYSFNIKVDIMSNKDAEIFVDTGFFRSNEYRYGPIQFGIPFCDFIKRTDYDIPSVISHSNLHPCPIRKGELISLYLQRPNASNFPPLIPEGRWKFMTKIMWKGYMAYCVNWYMKVVYPLPFA